jgi:hypothetical protein
VPTHRDVEDAAACDPHELALGVRRQLVVQAAQHAGAAARVVVLHEGAWGGQPEPGEPGVEAGLVPALHEPAAVVGEDGRLDDEDAGQRGGDEPHQ